MTQDRLPCFSATYPEGIKQISDKVQRNPVDIRVEASHHSPDIEQLFYQIDKNEREEVLFKLIAHYQPESTLVFCNTKQQCQQVANELRQHDLHALGLAW